MKLKLLKLIQSQAYFSFELPLTLLLFSILTLPAFADNQVISAHFDTSELFPIIKVPFGSAFRHS